MMGRPNRAALATSAVEMIQIRIEDLMELIDEAEGWGMQGQMVAHLRKVQADLHAVTQLLDNYVDVIDEEA